MTGAPGRSPSSAPDGYTVLAMPVGLVTGAAVANTPELFDTMLKEDFASTNQVVKELKANGVQFE